METHSATIIFRLDPDLKRDFERIAAELDSTPSQILRRHVKDIVEDYHRRNAQQGLFPAAGEAKAKPPRQPPVKKEKPAKSTGSRFLDGFIKKATK